MPDAWIVSAPGAENVPPETFTAAFPAAAPRPFDWTVKVPVAPPDWLVPIDTVALASPIKVPLPSTKNCPADESGGGEPGRGCVGCAARTLLACAIVSLRNNVSPAVMFAAVAFTGAAANS